MTTSDTPKFIARLRKIVKIIQDNKFITATELAKRSGVNRIRINDYIAWLKFYDVVDVKRVGRVRIITIQDDTEGKLKKLEEELKEKGILEFLS